MSPTKALTDTIWDWSEVFMRQTGRDFRQFMLSNNLSFSQVTVLMRLYHGGSRGVSELGEELGISNAAVSQSLDRLVQTSLITRTEDPDDRRAKQLILTEKGCALVKNVIDARSRWMEGLTTSLNGDQQSLVISALTLLTESARKMGG